MTTSSERGAIAANNILSGLCSVELGDRAELTRFTELVHGWIAECTIDDHEDKLDEELYWHLIRWAQHKEHANAERHARILQKRDEQVSAQA